MTTARRQLPRADKRVLLVRCDHTGGCDCHGRALAELRECTAREWAARSDVYPRVVLPPADPPAGIGRIGNADDRRDLLGALCAWACLAFAAMLMLALAIRNVWLWLS